MATNLNDTEQSIDLPKQERVERLGWLFLGGGAMLMVNGGLILHEFMPAQLMHAYALTVMCYGQILYLDEIEHVRERWLWIAVLATIPVHFLFVTGLIWWDMDHPDLAKTRVFVAKLTEAYVVEMLSVTPIINWFRRFSPTAGSQQGGRRGRFWKLIPRSWQSAGARVRKGFQGETAQQPQPTMVSVPGESEDFVDLATDIDLGKERRKSYLKWFFWGTGLTLLGVYFFEGEVLKGAWLYLLQASVLSMICYGHLLYVEELASLGAAWLWKAVAATIPWHVAFVGVLIAFGRGFPTVAPHPIAIIALLWTLSWLEMKLMVPITDAYRE